MEWIKRMNLKKALFTITFFSSLTAVILSGITVWLCEELSTSIAPQGVEVEIYESPFGINVTRRPNPTASAAGLAKFISVLQLILPILFFLTALVVTSTLFYRWKLKEPIMVLTNGAAHIMDNDLDFSIEAGNDDELGQLCAAFETMRRSLLINNRKLWHQTEEQKRLNAAFSHDLRNPITVLKGSVKMAIQCVNQEDGENIERVKNKQLMENLVRIENYAGRIERYVETMSNVQRLEQVQIEKVPVDSHVIIRELEKTLSFVVSDSGKQLVFKGNTAVGKAIFIDQSVLMQITENLVSNAIRFAKQTVSVAILIETDKLTLTVNDDGIGFPEKLLKNGIQPFGKGNEDAEHFGMGLYICELLCRKHGGELKIRNDSFGAAVDAVLKISQF